MATFTDPKALAAAIEDCIEQGGYLVMRFGHAQMRQLKEPETEVILAALKAAPVAPEEQRVKPLMMALESKEFNDLMMDWSMCMSLQEGDGISAWERIKTYILANAYYSSQPQRDEAKK